jgi:hypothetical protein
MAAIDDFYKALVEAFGTVEITPTVAVDLDPEIWGDVIGNGVKANEVAAALPSSYALREEHGFEIRARPLLVFQLRATDDPATRTRRFVAEMMARLDTDIIPVM